MIVKLNLLKRKSGSNLHLKCNYISPEQGNAQWYSLRSWIESSYRDIKSDGWQWHKTRLREPARAERIWLAMAVATLWTVTVGTKEQRHLSDKFKKQVITKIVKISKLN
ncbi:MAG: transposase [Symploca sp. SIO2C1]|nr:transposase [Symploca sp. SIO2C1]